MENFIDINSGVVWHTYGTTSPSTTITPSTPNVQYGSIHNSTDPIPMDANEGIMVGEDLENTVDDLLGIYDDPYTYIKTQYYRKKSNPILRDDIEEYGED